MIIHDDKALDYTGNWQLWILFRGKMVMFVLQTLELNITSDHETSPFRSVKH